MTEKEVMAEMKSLGTEQNCKVYSRHGVRGQMFGVSYANLEKIRKKIKSDHDLAGKLWATGNHDARILAMMIADPKQISERTIDAWSKDLDNYVITDAFTKLVVRSPLARKKMERWAKSKDEWTGSAGWILVSACAMQDGEAPDEYFEERLDAIERNIRSAKNRVRYAMNGALISIGLRNSTLQKKALAAAVRIGKVEVDHGETGCKTPDAVEYIRKAAQRKAKNASSKAN